MTEGSFIGLLINFEKLTVSFHVNKETIPFMKMENKTPLRVFAALNNGAALSNFEFSLLDNVEVIQEMEESNYQPAQFVLSNGFFDQIKWDVNKKGSNIELKDSKTFFSKDKPVFNCILSENILRKGEIPTLHYIEFHLQKLGGGFQIGLVASNEDIECEEEITTDDKVWCVGSKTVLTPIGIPFGGLEKVKLREGCFIGMLIDMKDGILSYVIPSEETPGEIETHITFGGFVDTLKVIACVYKDSIISISRYINSTTNIKNYLENVNGIREKSQKEFRPVSVKKKLVKHIKWSKPLRGKNILLSNNRKQFKNKWENETFNGVLSEQVFVERDYHFEFFVESEEMNSFYIGIAQTGATDLNEEPRNNEKVWAIGPKIVCDSKGKFSGDEFLKNLKIKGKFKIGLMLDLKKRELSYVIDGKTYLGFSAIPSEVRIYFAIEGDVKVSFLQRLFLDKSLSNKRKEEKPIDPESEEFKKKYSYDMEFSKKRKGKSVWLSKYKKSLFTEDGSSYGCVASERVMKTSMHYIEFHIDKKSKGIFFGVTDNERIKNFDFESCPRRNNSGVWALGMKVITNSEEDFIKSEESSNFIESLKECKFVGMIVDPKAKTVNFVNEKFEKPVELFKNVSEESLMFVCARNGAVITISNYKKYYKESDLDLGSIVGERENYKASEWVEKVKLEMNEDHPVFIDKKKLREREIKEEEEHKQLQERLRALSLLHPEASEWWTNSFSDRLVVNIKPFRQKFGNYLKTELKLNVNVIEILLLDIERELDSDGNGSIDLVEFRNFLKKANPSNKDNEEVDRSIIDYYNEFQEHVVTLDDERYLEEGLNPLKVACMVKGLHLDLFKKFIDNRKIDVKSMMNTLSFDGGNVLHYACYFGANVELLNFFLENKADPNLRDEEGLLAIHFALQNDLVVLLKALYDHTNNEESYLLHSAADHGCGIEILNFLKEKEYDVNQKYPDDGKIIFYKFFLLFIFL